jgi:6-phosphogluconolactonase (cycloisomerase 2 family)
VGTYTGFKYVHHSKPYGFGESKSKGIYVSRFNAATGELSEPELATEVINPSFLTISPDRKFLYAISEDPLSVGPPLDHSSYVSAFAIDHATGKLHFSEQRSRQRHQHVFHLDGQDRKIRDDGQLRKRQCFRGAGQG